MLVTGASLASPVLALLLPWLSQALPIVTLPGYMLVFFSLGAVAGGRVIAELGYLIEISPDDRRPEYSAYTNVLVAPSRLLPLVAGAMVQVVSFPLLFLVAAGATLARLVALEQLRRTPRTVHPRGAPSAET
jgi:MFS family permease